jgi:DNA-binding response OmpR family regulator
MPEGRITSEARRDVRGPCPAQNLSTLDDASPNERQPPNQQPPADEPREDVYDDGCMRIEHDNYYVACGGRSVKLPRAEFRLFSRLARNPERVVPADVLWRHVWGDGKPLNSESLHVYIYRLRKKFAPYGIEIGTMIGVGYRLVPAKPEGRDKPG